MLTEESVTDIRNDIDIIKQNHYIVNKEIDALTVKVDSVMDTMSNVDAELDHLETYSKRHRRIYGIPVAEGVEISMTCKPIGWSIHATF